jgi:excisionase family DNA binding protein
MEKQKYISIAELAKRLGISRIAVYKKVKKGDIKAIKIGRSFAVPTGDLNRKEKSIKGRPLGAGDKKMIDEAVRKTVQEYGEVLKKLGRE